MKAYSEPQIYIMWAGGAYTAAVLATNGFTRVRSSDGMFTQEFFIMPRRVGDTRP